MSDDDCWRGYVRPDVQGGDDASEKVNAFGRLPAIKPPRNTLEPDDQPPMVRHALDAAAALPSMSIHSKEKAMSEEWSDEELAAAVEAYNRMARHDAERKPYSKRQYYRVLTAAFPNRTEKAFEYRMQNISAVLDENGEAWIAGLKPAGNIGTRMKPRLATLLAKTAKQRAARKAVAPEALYKDQLPAIRDWLIEVARARTVVRYGEAMTAFGIGHRNIRRVMDFLGHQSENLSEPILTALIVGPNGRCSDGFEKEFGVADDEAERDRLYEYWPAKDNEKVLPVPAQRIDVRAARFAAVEVRPDQAAFRRLVFLAHDGRCAISGCNVDEALDAAHKSGRDWRQGHNSAEDGLLLRKDLHALYDSGLLTIDDARVVHIFPGIAAHYGLFDGQALKL